MRELVVVVLAAACLLGCARKSECERLAERVHEMSVAELGPLVPAGRKHELDASLAHEKSAIVDKCRQHPLTAGQRECVARAHTVLDLRACGI